MAFEFIVSTVPVGQSCGRGCEHQNGHNDDNGCFEIILTGINRCLDHMYVAGIAGNSFLICLLFHGLIVCGLFRCIRLIFEHRFGNVMAVFPFVHE